MIRRSVEENLRLVFQAAKRARVNDPRPVPLEFRPEIVTRLGKFPPARVGRFLGKWGEDPLLIGLHLLAAFPARGGKCRPFSKIGFVRHNGSGVASGIPGSACDSHAG